ncbi:MAG: aldolase [Oscillospiraceae bacterium]|nr:aldolase [Oscillospiraceae bacterium]
MLNLMYITNDPAVARIAEEHGVDRIWVDMEFIGKYARQGGMDTVQLHHTIEDVRTIRAAVSRSEVLVRVNPIHEATADYGDSAWEIPAAVDAGADVVMLPFFKTVDEVRTFLRLVDGRAKTMLLVETPEAAEIIDEILALDGIDEIHIGLNDLSLGCGKKFMFELLTDGTVERLCAKFRAKGIPYGFGGIAALGKGMLPAERVIREHYRLGSTRAILSRSFCNTSIVTDLSQIDQIFRTGMAEIRALEAECAAHAPEDEYYAENRRQVELAVKVIHAGIVEREQYST